MVMCANLYEILYRKMTISQDPDAANDQSGSEATGEGTRSKVVRPIAGTVSPLLSGKDTFAPVELEAKAFLPFPDQFLGAADLGNTGWNMLVQAEVTQGSEYA